MRPPLFRLRCGRLRGTVQMFKGLLFWGSLAVAALFAGEALAEKRVALVIGNSAYTNVRPLANPANDAGAVAALFKSAGFDVVTAKNDLAGVEMRRAFRDFAEQASKADIAVVYYAGHGIEVDGTNYLLPIDTALKRDIDVEDEAVSLDRVMRLLEPAKRLRLIILDACRDNPFVRTMQRTIESRSVGRGLAKVDPITSDTLIAFAAKAGSTASDGEGKHSPFTAALVKNLTVPGLDLRIAFGRVRDDVLSSTGHKQEPFVYGSLGGTTVALVPEPPKQAAPVVTPPPAAAVDANAAMRRDYELAVQVGTKESFDAFLAVYTTGFYADLARAHRAKLVAAEAPANSRISILPPPVTPQPPPPPVQPRTPPTNTANLTPATPAEPPKAADPSPETEKLMHAELQRLGCYSGALDASWGNPSRRAVELFNKHARQKLDVKLASIGAIDILRGIDKRVCPLTCKRGFRAEGDECVKITCGPGFVLDGDGDCVRERKAAPEKAQEKRAPSRTAARPPADEPPARRSAPPRRESGDGGGGGGRVGVVCGDNGCLNVPLGCKSELRDIGRGQAAVVLCGNR
jgi:uncharacterized caspase-like protein